MLLCFVFLCLRSRFKARESGDLKITFGLALMHRIQPFFRSFAFSSHVPIYSDQVFGLLGLRGEPSFSDTINVMTMKLTGQIVR